VFWFYLPQFTDVSAVRDAICGMTGLQVVSLALVARLNLASYGWVMTATTPGLTYPQAMVVAESSTAMSNTLPGGAAIGIATSWSMYSSWGFSRSRITVSLLVSGIWNSFLKLGLPLVALACLAVQGRASVGRPLAAAAGVAGLLGAVAVLGAILHSEPAAVRTGEVAGRLVSALRRPLGRGPVRGWEHATVKFRRRTVLLLRARWLRLNPRHRRQPPAAALRAAAVAAPRRRRAGRGRLGRGAGGLRARAPGHRRAADAGCVGLVEVALVAGLVAGGGPRVEVVAGVLVHRALTYLLPIPHGVATWLFWPRNTSWRRPPGAAPRTDLVPET
jgi:putative heme transporter